MSHEGEDPYFTEVNAVKVNAPRHSAGWGQGGHELELGLRPTSDPGH